MADLSDDIAVFEAMEPGLKQDHDGDWVVVRDRELVGTYPSFEDAATVAVDRFDRGPYLIRQIGAPPMSMPAAVMYRPASAHDTRRV